MYFLIIVEFFLSENNLLTYLPTYPTLPYLPYLTLPSLPTYLLTYLLLPLKFSKMINWGRWSEIEVVMLPGRYLKDELFTKMLSISVADFSVTLVGSVV